MATIKEAASEFLANKRIAVTGVSRKPKDHGANTVSSVYATADMTCSRSTPMPTRSRVPIATTT